MGFVKFLVGVIGSIVAFVVAIKLLALLLAIVGFALKLIWLAVVVGIILFIAFAIYKLISPRSAHNV
jgi:hypothetical protein